MDPEVFCENKGPVENSRPARMMIIEIFPRTLSSSFEFAAKFIADRCAWKPFSTYWSRVDPLCRQNGNGPQEAQKRTQKAQKRTKSSRGLRGLNGFSFLNPFNPRNPRLP